nr:myosin-4-like [Megalopta genalis]
MSAKVAKPAPPPAAKDVTSLQVSLPQMLDLALGTPEVGAINFNILHNFLHVLLHQIDLKSTKVEYRGDEAARMKTMVSTLQTGPSFYLQEYSIIDSSKNITTRSAVVATADVITENAAGDDQVDLRKSKGSRQKVGAGQDVDFRETVIYVEPIVNDVIPSALAFKRLEQNVIELQRKFQALEELSTNAELVERLKGKVTDPVTDIWNIINITKRLDASEQGIDKLTTMVQDVLKGDVAVEGTTEVPQELEERLTNLERVLNNLESTVQNLEIIANVTVEDAEEPLARPQTAKPEAEPGLQPRVSLSQILGGVDVKDMHEQMITLQKDVSKMRDDLKNLNEKVADVQTAVAKKDEKEKSVKEQAEPKAVIPASTEIAQSEESDQPPTPKAPESPKKVQKEVETDREEYIDQDEINIINERLSRLEKDVICLQELVNSAPMAGMTGNAELDELVSKIQSVQDDMEKLNQTADRLIDDKENREVHLNALLEQIELLKTIKADREDLEDALADKADARAVHRKVSYDQFDAACDDLAQGLEEAVNKLGKQETIWQEALDEVQKEIEGKVDKIEMTPLKDFVSTRLKAVQDKLRSVAQMRDDTEAAGTKKLLRDVQCISCDKNVVMKIHDTNKAKLDPFPCGISMKPYLTYELDQVRKQNKRLPHSRNMIQYEAALQEEAKKQKSARSEKLVKTPRDHLCNRYCGGSHTVTTPQQRVMRMGHFISQWGPEVVQLTEGMVKGTDGKMYRGRPLPAKIDVCGTGYCQDYGEAKPSERSVGSQSRRSVEKQPSVSSRKRSVKSVSSEAMKQSPDQESHKAEPDEPVPEERRHSRGRYYSDQIIHYEADEDEAEEY